MNSSQARRWIALRTLWWTLGAMVVVGLLEFFLSGTAKFRVEVPLVLGFSVGFLNLTGNILAAVLVWIFRK